MDYAITDFDGVVQSTERGKAFSYILGTMMLTGKIPEGLSEALVNEVIEQCAGGTTEEYVDRVWHKFQPCFWKARTGKFSEQERDSLCSQVAATVGDSLADDVLKYAGLTGQCTPQDFKHAVVGALEGLRGKQALRQARTACYEVVYHTSEPIRQNIEFFRAAHENGIKWGLINQSERSRMNRHFERDRQLGITDLEKIFPDRWIMCIGDEKKKKQGFNKVQGYVELCQRIGTTPSNTLTFEDTEDGVGAAKDAGLVCIGLGDEAKLSGADHVICSGYLDALIPLVNVMKERTAEEFLKHLKHATPE